jgi:hypothetical protein
MVQKKQNWAKGLTAAVNLATSVGAVLAVGLFGGKWLDARFATGNLYTILGFMLGAASAMKMLWDNLMKDSKKNASQENPDKKSKSDN